MVNNNFRFHAELSRLKTLSKEFTVLEQEHEVLKKRFIELQTEHMLLKNIEERTYKTYYQKYIRF